MKFIGNVVIMLGQYKSFLLLGVIGILWLGSAEGGIRASDTTSECAAEGRKNILFLVVDDLNTWLLKSTLWEEATHCLLMFRVPGVTEPNEVSRTPVSLLDVYPTLIELAGLASPEHDLDGVSLIPQLKDPATPRPGPVMTEYKEHMTVRTGRYRYIRYQDGSEELYGRSEDPNEWNNLADRSELSSIKKRLADVLPDADDMSAPVPSKR